MDINGIVTRRRNREILYKNPVDLGIDGLSLSTNPDPIVSADPIDNPTPYIEPNHKKYLLGEILDGKLLIYIVIVVCAELFGVIVRKWKFFVAISSLVLGGWFLHVIMYTEKHNLLPFKIATLCSG